MSEAENSRAPHKCATPPRGNRFMTVAEIMSIPSGLSEEEWSRHAKAIRENRPVETPAA
jgi:hypothetical protein